MLRPWFARNGWGLAIGLGLTLGAIALHLAGLTERLELLAFDYYVRDRSRIPASDRIVHIDIGDDALDRVESWPWPRDLQGELIRILHELGADRIAMDIVWTEPKAGEVRDPSIGRYADLEGVVERIGELTAENLVFPDDELARAIAESGNVYLSLYYEPPRETGDDSDVRTRVAGVVRERFDLDTSEIAARLGLKPVEVAPILPGIKRAVAEEKVSEVLDTRPAAAAPEVHAAILSTPFDRETADRADVLAGYFRQLSLRRLRESCPEVPPQLAGKLPRIGRVVPPLYKLTAGARRVGFVTFEPDFDGRTRHLPLLLDWDGRLVEQLAFAVARDELDIRVEDLEIDGRGDLSIRGRGSRKPMRVQLDRQGQLLINWHLAPAGWQNCFQHVPVTQLLRIYDCRRNMADNEHRRQAAIAHAMHLVKDERSFEAYRQRVNDAIERRRRLRWADFRGGLDRATRDALEGEARALEEQAQRDEAETVEFIREQWGALQGEPNPADPAIADEYKRFAEADRYVSRIAAELQRVNAELATTEQQLMRELRPLIQDRICFVGYTATAVADMVNTPAYPRMPGVLVHSNLLNSFLQGQFRTWSERWMQALIISVFGAAVTVLSLTRGPRFTFLLVLVALTITFLLGGLTTFERMDHWVRLLTAMASTFVIWAVIVLLRYLTTDRQRRQFSKAVAQYVSPAVARQIAGSTTQLDLAPSSRVVSCLFSDLAGFTRMSERLGPDGTRMVLNPYLEAMSAVLHRHDALINKFIGDGIFAFFNPPILPCPAHEQAACSAALDCQAALEELPQRFRDHPMGAEFGRLSMRIGIASGPVFVGDYGSENKLDYTCVGDTVNLASRLEGANKAFGSRILISGTTYHAAREMFVCRHLGLLQVVGQSVAVPVYELLGRAGEVDGAVLEYAQLFEEAVGAFTLRDFPRSGRGFEHCLSLHPQDPGAQRYLRVIRAFDGQSPPEDWRPVLELSEK